MGCVPPAEGAGEEKESASVAVPVAATAAEEEDSEEARLTRKRERNKLRSKRQARLRSPRAAPPHRKYLGRRVHLERRGISFLVFPGGRTRLTTSKVMTATPRCLPRPDKMPPRGGSNLPENLVLACSWFAGDSISAGCGILYQGFCRDETPLCRDYRRSGSAIATR